VTSSLEPESRIARASDGEPLTYRIDEIDEIDQIDDIDELQDERTPRGGVADRAARTPILTTHGLVSSVHHWMFFTPHFARARPVLSWHYRGHGGQPVPRDRGVSVAQFADDAHAVWRASGAAPAIVVGLSFGVQVALEIWRRHPASVRALVLICGTAGHPLDRVSSSPVLRGAATRLFRALGHQRLLASGALAVLRTRGGQRLARELTYLSGGALRDACPSEVLEGLFGHVATLDPQLIGNLVAAYLEHTAEDVLPTIRVPTLIIAGDRDQLTPVAAAERMQRAIPGSELKVFPGHTHLVQVEQPAQVHAAIEAFLQAHAL
jgi:pimeloyl-ACP methyl ester carboxylesterase